MASVIFGRFRKRIRLTQLQHTRLYVNLGSAHQAPRGWLNLDRSVHVLIDRIPGLAAGLYAARLLPADQYENARSGRWKAVHFWDARFPIPVPDSSADYVYSSHFLEHLDLVIAERVLAECFRILKPGGLIRIVVPDLYRISREYLAILDRIEAGQLTPSDMTNYLGTPVRADQVSEAFAAQFFEPTVERQRLFGHRWMYDKLSLRRALERAGFSSVTEKPFQHGSVPDLDQLDSRPSNSLHMEARKE
jgi:predicted SAM-dependent methyltransferase